nr:RNA polymerase subunit sigma-70 [Enterococcus faecalis]
MDAELPEPQLIASLARRHYLEDVSKVQLAKEFGISRFRIARLLAKGREEGIIRLEIIDPSTDLPMLS